MSPPEHALISKSRKLFCICLLANILLHGYSIWIFKNQNEVPFGACYLFYLFF